MEEVDRLRADLTIANMQAARDRATIERLQNELRTCRDDAQHQIRNLLAVVRSIARRTIAAEESAEDYQARLDSRLASITRVQGYILRTPQTGVDLGTLVTGELLAFGIDLGEGAQVSGDRVCLTPKTATVLGLAFHELAQMTIGAVVPTPIEKRIDVRWTTGPDGPDTPPAAAIESSADGTQPVSDRMGRPPDTHWLQIRWIDSGVGPKDLSKLAFAHDILEQAIPYQLKGTARFDPADAGISCRIRLPLTCVENVAA